MFRSSTVYLPLWYRLCLGFCSDDIGGDRGLMRTEGIDRDGGDVELIVYMYHRLQGTRGSHVYRVHEDHMRPIVQ